MEATRRPGAAFGRLGRGATMLVAIVGVVAACSNQAGGNATNPATQAAPTQAVPSTATESMSATAPAPGDATLGIATDPDLGDYVTGADGMALYVFLPDEGKDTSQCNDSCADNWPPLTVEDAADASAGEGVTGEVGTITRDDGTVQVTLGGAPLYYFAADQAAGDVKGQGVNDVWYLASAEGTPVGDDDEPAAEQTPCGQRYCY